MGSEVEQDKGQLPVRKVPSLDPTMVSAKGGGGVGVIFPRAKPWTIPIKPDSVPPMDPQTLFQYCGFKVVSGGIMGAVVGVAMGAFMSAMSNDVQNVQMVHGREVPAAPLREQLRAGVKGFGSKTKGWAKSFGILTALLRGQSVSSRRHGASTMCGIKSQAVVS